MVTMTKNETIKDNLTWLVVDVVKKERKQTKAEIPAIVSQEFVAHNAFKAKYEKYFGSTNSCRHDAFLKRDHDDHLYDDALLTGEKSAKRQRTSRGSKSARGSSSKQPAKGSNTTSSEQLQQQDYDAWVKILETHEDKVIPKDETPYLLNEFQSFDMRVPTIADHKRIKDTLKDMIKNQFRNAEEYAYHLEQAQNYMENQIVWENRQEDLITLKKDTLLLYGPQRNPNEPQADSFSDADLKYLNKKNIEDMYYMCQNKKVNIHENRLLNSLPVFIRSCVIWERVHDSQLGIKSYQKKINLIAPTLTVYGIDELNTYYVVNVPFVGIVYLNNKEEKRIMGLT
ncbi:hypothetical protein Tco_1354640 [Tanacetum coccineum]